MLPASLLFLSFVSAFAMSINGLAMKTDAMYGAADSKGNIPKFNTSHYNVNKISCCMFAAFFEFFEEESASTLKTVCYCRYHYCLF